MYITEEKVSPKVFKSTKLKSIFMSVCNEIGHLNL